MDNVKSQDEYEIIAALLCDVQTLHGGLFGTDRALRLTLQKVRSRMSREGLSFLMKTLPRLGKCVDHALAGGCLNKTEHRFATLPGSQLPRFLGELFQRIFANDGTVLPNPCTKTIGVIRDILYLFYKYEIPYSIENEQQVINDFIKTEVEVKSSSLFCTQVGVEADTLASNSRRKRPNQTNTLNAASIVREARIRLSNLFSGFDLTDIVPRHGPGAVSTKEQLSAKFTFTTVSERLIASYPLDAYFYASLGHVCDAKLDSIQLGESSAKVVLVPKDSRGPRLISCEPLDFQWIQQGLSRALVRWVEEHPSTNRRVNFTDQQPNQIAALVGSRDGRYATLDLKEASDRVSVGLVRAIFPEHVSNVLMNCRSLSTVLPDKTKLDLDKYAPMGSALCFPVLALTVWALVSTVMPDEDSRERVLVYGDDVIVPAAQAENAINTLELFGLKVNRSKSCTKGLFRESCGVDAYAGVNVTPVRLRTVWSSDLSPEVYTSWIAYATSFYHRRYYQLYDLVVARLHRVYGTLCETSMNVSCPSLPEVPEGWRPKRSRINHKLQKREWLVRDVKSPKVITEMDGWKMLLRFFSYREGTGSSPSTSLTPLKPGPGKSFRNDITEPFSVREYTKRRTCIFVRRWR